MAKGIQAGEQDFYIAKQVSRAPIYEMHHHSAYELYYMVKGQREYFIEDRFYMVEEGDMVLIPPKMFHRVAGDGGLRFLVHFSENFLSACFTPSALRAMLERLPAVFRGDERQREQLRHCLESMYAPENGQNPQLMAGYLYQLLFAAVNERNIYISQAHGDARITGIVRYINENYDRIEDISQIAAHFYISKYHLCRYFKKNLGLSLVGYLNTIKIRHACRMIQEGAGNLTEIAMACGFNSSSYFCKVFRSETGISPSAYKRTTK